MINTIELSQWVLEQKAAHDSLCTLDNSNLMSLGASVAYQAVMDKMFVMALDLVDPPDKPESETINIPIRTV